MHNYCIDDPLQAIIPFGQRYFYPFSKFAIDAAGKPLHPISTDRTLTSHPLDLLSFAPGERGFLQLEIDHPGKNQTGEYVCEANAVTDSGHTVTFSTTTEVTSSSPTTADLIAYVTHIREDLNKCCRDQKPEVFFSAAVTTHMDIASGVVVFDKVFSNKGSSYDNHSGLFTCSVSGYYRFDLNALAYIQTQFYLYLQQNNQNVIAVFARDGPGNQGGSSNSAIIHLSAGDVMRVVTNGHSKMYGSALDAFVTLSGELISAD